MTSAKVNEKMLFSRKELFRMMWPLALQGILAVSIGMADTLMVSGKGEDALAGVSLVSSLDILLITLFTSLAAGGAVVLAQAMGCKDRARAAEASKQLLYTTTLFATMISLAVLFFRRPILRLLFGAVEADVMGNAESYLFYLAFSFPFLAIENCVAASLRAEGDTMISLKVSIFKNLMNVGGNAILIYAVNLGAAGAAIATLGSRVIGGVIMLFCVCSPKRQIRITRLFHYRPNFSMIRSILKIGVPNGVENTMFQAGRLMTASLVSTLGTAAIAANAAVLSLANFQYNAAASVQGTMVTVVGRCIGAGEKKQARYYSFLLLGIGYLLVLAVNIVIGSLSVPLLWLFQLSAEAFSQAIGLFFFHAVVSVLLWPTAFCLPCCFRAASDVRFTMVVSVFSMWLFRVAAAYVFAPAEVSVFGLFSFPGAGMGLFGVWFAMSLDWVFRAAIFILRLFRGTWLKKYKESI